MSKSLFSVTPDPLTGGGIFSALQSLDPPWVEEDIALQLDLAYYGNYSGGKVVSPLIDRLLTADKLTSIDMTTLACVLMATNKERWSREWATRSAEYDPIQNYNMTEEMTDDETITEYGRTHTRTDNLAHTETRTDNLTRTIDNQETTTPNLTSTSQQATRGFNSSSDVNTDKETATNTGTNRVDTDGTEHNTGTQGTTGSNTGTQTDADTGSDTSTRNYTLTRSGNIGVTTSQQMLQSERDLWMWSYFYDVVFPDVDEVLTVPVYADGEGADGTSGGIIPRGTIAISENGLYDVTTYAKANVSVPLPSGAVNITTNGRHDVASYEFADVLVPNSYAEADEGKVVNNGVLVAQTGPLEISENGTYNTTTKNEVIVDVSSGIPANTFNGVGLIIANPTATNCVVVLYEPYTTGSSTPTLPGNRKAYMTYEQILNFMRIPAFSQMCLYNYVNDAFIAGFGLELLCTNLNGAKTTDTINRPITDYQALFMDSCYNGAVNDSYSTSQIYLNPEVNTQYFAYMKDRNSTYTASITFTDSTHLDYGGSRQTRLYGLLKS